MAPILRDDNTRVLAVGTSHAAAPVTSPARPAAFLAGQRLLPIEPEARRPLRDPFGLSPEVVCGERGGSEEGERRRAEGKGGADPQLSPSADPQPIGAIVKEVVDGLLVEGAVLVTRHEPRATSPEPRFSKPRPAESVTDLVRAWTDADRRVTARVVLLGWMADGWVRRQPDRAAAIREVREALVAAGISGESARVGRFIALYWVARLLCAPTDCGVTRLRAMLPLAKRNLKTQRFELRAKTREAAIELWRLAILEGWTAATLQRKVTELRPGRPTPPSRQARPLKLRVLRTLARLDAGELAEVVAACQARLGSLARAA